MPVIPVSLTAHKVNNTFRVQYGSGFFEAPFFPVLQTELFEDITTELLEVILLDGQTTDTVTLSAYKVKRNTFIAVGGND